jgi:hypothetical protein
MCEAHRSDVCRYRENLCRDMSIFLKIENQMTEYVWETDERKGLNKMPIFLYLGLDSWSALL